MLGRGSAVLVAIALMTAGCSFGALDGFSSGGMPAEAGPGVDGGEHGADSGVTVAARSCKALKERTAGVASGFYRVDPDGSGALPEIEVYCDMATAGGGWTLVARSVEDGSGAFGWGSTRGTVRDELAPYSIDTLGSGLEFDEILVGERGSGNAFAGSAYRMAISRQLLLKHASSAFQPSGTHAAVGTCDPSGGPLMLAWAGHSARPDRFHFRDKAQAADEAGGIYGLFPNGFQVLYDDCSRGGQLQRRQGQILVR